MKKWISAALVGAAGFAFGIVVARHWRAPVALITGDSEEYKAAEQALRQRLTEVEKERDDLRTAQGAAPAMPSTQKPVAAPPVSADDPVTRQELVRLLNEKNEKLTAAERSLGELELKLQQMEGRVAELTGESRRLSDSEKNLKERLDSTTRLAEALEEQSKMREARMAQVEVSNQELRKRTDESAARIAKLAKLGDDMQDLTRRREAYVSNILRRYRDVTDYYRQVSLRQDTTPRETDVSRIQNTVSLVEEDMRQLQALDALAGRLQKELAGVKK